jgi:hypothetical protein
MRPVAIGDDRSFAMSDPGSLRLVALVKSLLGKGGTTDFLVRPWEFGGLGSPSMGIRRTRKSVVPLNQQPVCGGPHDPRALAAILALCT